MGGVSCVFLSIVLRVNFEIALGMVTGGADLRGLLPYHDVAAVAALPHLHLALGKHLRHLHVAQQRPIALLMVLLNGPHQAEPLGQLMEALLIGGPGNCVAIWKMLRKKGCVPSALTQNVKDFLASPEIENIFENSDFLVLLSQAQGDRQILAKQLGISPHQLSYVTHTNSGEGLLFFGNTTIPFVDRFPQNTELYAIMTTRPEDKKQEMNRA